ncbi:MAG: hypothetical protein GX647_04875 [Clostridiales bacterium]|jgi:hypothetical protein|nr:hypothetical protein [Clostridiales bacterium]
MMIAILLTVYLGTLLIDFRAHLKDSKALVKALYLALLFVSFSVLTLYEFGVEIPSPAGPIQDAVRALFGVE